jgi:hypothetical protein
MKLYIGQVLKNKLSNDSEIMVRIISLNVAGTNMPRVTDHRETLPDAYLISKNLTWAAPIENLFADEETKSIEAREYEMTHVHKDSLIHYNF